MSAVALWRAALVLLAAGLSGLIVWAAGAASFGASFSAIASDPWGLVSLADLYLGFVVAGTAIALVERPAAALLWIVGLLVLGNVLGAVWLALRLPEIAARLRRPR